MVVIHNRGNTIMPDDSTIVRDIQLTIRRELDRRGLSLKVISFDSGIPYSTLLSYFPGDKDAVPHIMPVLALRKLTGPVPSDLLSLLLEDNWQIVRAPEECDHDAIAEACKAYLATKEKARRDAEEEAPLAVIAGGRT